MTTYQHLGPYSDLVAMAERMHPLYTRATPGLETQERVRAALRWGTVEDMPIEPTLEHWWQHDGLDCEEVSWSVGYGPRTHAWVFKPTDAKGPLPAIVALHSHDGNKFFGKEKIADGPGAPHPLVVDYRKDVYGDRAFVNALARAGFVVVVHDVFAWGSRRFPLESMPATMRDHASSDTASDPSAEDIRRYNAAAGHHEHLIEKYCSVLGTTFAGVVNYEDRVATNYLRTRADVIHDRIGCIGLSGGGCRAALLQATSEHIKAAVVVGMMSTYEGLLDHNVASHTWMFFPSTWAQHGDWPDLAACRAPSPLLVQYDEDDDLFTMAGMRAAHERISEHYQSVGAPDSYKGEFYPGPHKFDREMQESAFAWLARQLG
jgi:dienelactone hydrolase